MKTKGKVIGIVSNLVTVQVDGPVAENELCYINLGGTKRHSPAGRGHKSQRRQGFRPSVRKHEGP